jgi:hypothetical protein
MQEIVLAVVGVCQAKKECLLGSNVILISSPPLLLVSFIGKGQIPVLSAAWRLQRSLSRGLVLDGSLAAGGTGEPFLYLRLTCKI